MCLCVCVCLCNTVLVRFGITVIGLKLISCHICNVIYVITAICHVYILVVTKLVKRNRHFNLSFQDTDILSNG